MAKDTWQRMSGKQEDEVKVYDDLSPVEDEDTRRVPRGLEAMGERPDDEDEKSGRFSLKRKKSGQTRSLGGLEAMGERPEDDSRTARDDDPDAPVSRSISDLPLDEEEAKLLDSGAGEELSEEDEEESVHRSRKGKRPAVKVTKGKKKKGKSKPLPTWVRRTALTVVTLTVVLFLGLMVLARILPDQTALQQPENFVASVVSPLQTLFSDATEAVTGYLRTLKLRATIETEYNNLRAENEQLVYQAMLADELQQKLASYEDMFDEVSANESMNPITATVIGRTDGNYFSTFTINRGTRDGLEDYMAVTISGALVGYTEDTKESSATVRTIIDSEASIAGLIQSSRDQGSIKGTLGVDGTAMCRMYYLPEDNLPRPGDVVVTSGVGMSFPKGIPIGTVRESTRGMEANKQYIVVEPTVDFEHIEYVIVLRYKPAAEAVEGRDTSATDIEYVALATARPYPTLRIGGGTTFGATETPEPDATATPSPSPTPKPTATPKPTPVPTLVPAETPPPLEYVVIGSPTVEPTASPTPSPTPYATPDLGDMTWEVD